MDQIPLDTGSRSRLKSIAHHLQAVVLVGARGVSPAVIAETRRALHDHELIKVRIGAADRLRRQALVSELARVCGAAAIQQVGKVTVLYRKNPDPNPRLSNLSRYGA